MHVRTHPPHAARLLAPLDDVDERAKVFVRVLAPANEYADFIVISLSVLAAVAVVCCRCLPLSMSLAACLLMRIGGYGLQRTIRMTTTTYGALLLVFA